MKKLKNIVFALFAVGFTFNLSADTFDMICDRFGANPGSSFHKSMMDAKV